MNKPHDDSLDDRLRRSDPAGPGLKASPENLPPTDKVRNPIRDWWLTTSTRVRRSLVGGVGVAAAASVVVAGTFGTASSPLIVMAVNASPESMSSQSASVGDSKMMMMPYLSYEYTAADTLSAATGRGHVYRLDLAGTPETVLHNAAGYFGVSGAPQKSQYFDATWPTYVVGPEDGSAPSISVSWSGTGSWWYSNPAAYPEQNCLHERRVGKGADSYIECTEYEPAITGLNPDETETRQLASEFFAAMGVSFQSADISVMVDDWSSFASIALKVAGQPTAIEWSISWSGNGELSWAQGNSVSIVDAGEFDTVSDVTAVERLADWRWYGAGPTDYNSGMWMMKSSVDPGFGAMEGDVVAVEPVEPTEEPDAAETTEPVQPDPNTPVVDPTDNPTDVDPTDIPTPEPTDIPTPEPTEPEMVVQTITIDEAEPALLLVWDASGGAWLVPGVALTGADSWWQTVITLVEGVIQLPEPIDPMPMD